MMLKTCGTTTLLRCLPRLLEFTAALGMELEWVGYSRKNYSFPGDQCFPHSSFDQELAYLKVGKAVKQARARFTCAALGCIGVLALFPFDAHAEEDSPTKRPKPPDTTRITP